MADGQTPASATARFPDLPKVLDYPVTIGLTVEVIAVVVLLLIAKRYDPSGGSFTIALLIVTAMIGLTIYAALFTVPQDEETATVIGGLVAAFGAVVAFWLRGRNGGDK